MYKFFKVWLNKMSYLVLIWVSQPPELRYVNLYEKKEAA